MFEKARVSKIKGKRVYVVLEKKAECETCKVCVFGKKQRITMPAVSKIDCKVGDEVTVEMPQKSILSAPMFLYVIPLAFMIGGAFLGKLFSEIMQIVFAFAFLAVSFGGVWLIDKFYFRNKEKYNVVITEKIQATPITETNIDIKDINTKADIDAKED